MFLMNWTFLTVALVYSRTECILLYRRCGGMVDSSELCFFCLFLSVCSGKFDPKAMNNFYDNIQPGPVVRPKKGEEKARALVMISGATRSI